MRNKLLTHAIVVTALLFATMAAFAQSPHGSYEALFEAAIDAITWDFHDDWAFRATSSGKDGDRVGRYDPRLPEDERWTLISVDGRVPTDEESAEYADSRGDHHFGHDDGDDDDNDDNDAIDMVEPGTLELVEETDDYWLLSFVPTEDDEDDDVGRKVLESMYGTVKIIKDGEYLAYIDIRNEKPIRPKFGVKMSKFLMRLAFGPAADDGPVVMQSMDFAIKLSAFVLVRVNEAESMAFSDFEYAGEVR
jgi:hypothetical protein